MGGYLASGFLYIFYKYMENIFSQPKRTGKQISVFRCVCRTQTSVRFTGSEKQPKAEAAFGCLNIQKN